MHSTSVPGTQQLFQNAVEWLKKWMSAYRVQGFYVSAFSGAAKF